MCGGMRGAARGHTQRGARGAGRGQFPVSAAVRVNPVIHAHTVELETKVAEDYAMFYNHGEGHYYDYAKRMLTPK